MGKEIFCSVSFLGFLLVNIAGKDARLHFGLAEPLLAKSVAISVLPMISLLVYHTVSGLDLSD